MLRLGKEVVLLTVYLDVLIILNIYVNYFLLKATAKITHTKLHTSRCIISSVVGSLFSLTILLPPLNFLIAMFIKLFAAIIVVAVAFGISNFKKFLKMTYFFFSINFIFAGVMLGIYLLIQPSFMQFNNANFYIDFSLMTLVISTIIAYIAVSIVRYFLDRKAAFNEKYLVIMSVNGKTITLKGMADTGNTLTDIFSGKPVIICNINLLKKVLSMEFINAIMTENLDELQSYVINHKELKGLKLIPFSTINSTGLIPIFSPDNVYIKSESNNEYKNVNALIGICENQGDICDAIFNPSLVM